MNEPISKEEYEKIITSAPSDMELPVYVGKHNDELLYLDLVKAKSIAMYGTTGISSIYSNRVSIKICDRDRQEPLLIQSDR